MFIFDLFQPKWMRRIIERSETFQEAEMFGRNYEPKKNVDYSWVERHSADEFRFFESRVDTIEAKADSLVKYLGAGSGIIALLTAKAPTWQVVPSLLLLLLALFVAIRALQPAELPSLPKTKTAFAFADKYDSKDATASFAAKTAAATVGMEIAANTKGKCVRVAFWLFLGALAWLVGYAAIAAILKR
jgi:hypothetical protein